MLAVTLVFGSFLLIGFLLVGVIGGWVARDYMLNYQENPQVHPEMLFWFYIHIKIKVNVDVLVKKRNHLI